MNEIILIDDFPHQIGVVEDTRIKHRNDHIGTRIPGIPSSFDTNAVVVIAVKNTPVAHQIPLIVVVRIIRSGRAIHARIGFDTLHPRNMLPCRNHSIELLDVEIARHS